ncbi:MAG: carboxypeptidase-like regulatory domain-containing protein, partial [Bacteroidales bacterium]|nr:carboxypeptidase-like regulatory domain-containing protein [Bacteroidales bacterium]
MKKFTIYYILLLFGVVFLFLFECTHNPFENTKITIDEKIISGKVELSDHSKPNGVYVWLEGFDIGTWTDAHGNFEISLPHARTQSDGRITGTYKLFFFLANYQLDSSFVVIRNGELQLSHGDINESGQLKRPKFLKKILKIETFVSPTSVAENNEE